MSLKEDLTITEKIKYELESIRDIRNQVDIAYSTFKALFRPGINYSCCVCGYNAENHNKQSSTTYQSLPSIINHNFIETINVFGLENIHTIFDHEYVKVELSCNGLHITSHSSNYKEIILGHIEIILENILNAVKKEHQELKELVPILEEFNAFVTLFEPQKDISNNNKQLPFEDEEEE